MRKPLRSAVLVLLSITAFAAVASSDHRETATPFARKAPILVEGGRALHAVLLKDAPLALRAFGDDRKQNGVARKQALEQQANKEYRALLKTRQADFMGVAAAKIGRTPAVTRSYQLAANALVMALSPSEAKALRELPEVAAVHPVLRHFPQTDRGPAHVGAPAMWTGTAGLPATRGEGLVVGVIDTGIRPGHPSFADVGDDGYDHVNPRGAGNYLGDCALPAAAHYCNDKLIGIVSFPEITGTFGDAAPPYGLDYEGHGTHVASTVAGNVVYDVPAYGPIGTLGEYTFPEISGVAPHANIVSYQVCHQGELGFGCDTTLTVAAVEHAIENGIDVLNYSIGGFAEDPWFSIDGMAFLSARAAGIHVAASAGNEGPNWRTIGSPATSPWLTSVAAYTHGRSFSDITLGNFAGGAAPPAAMTGKGVTHGFAGPLVAAGDHGDAQCLEPFAADTFAGAIVICERGGNARVDKGVNVLAGGAGGMVLVNVNAAEDDLVADFHALPAIHLNRVDGAALIAWLRSGAGHTAEISATTVGTDPALADHAGIFSSRGPAFPYGDMLAPHVAAPGVSIYAAFSDDQRFSAEPVEMPFTMLDGTSMASPHVAGALALLAAVHPDWTPAEMQSALMLTSVSDTRNDLGAPSVPFEQGAGRIDIPAAANAALLLDITNEEYLAADPGQGGDPAALNLPALAQDDCLVECRWTRRFRAVNAGSWTVSATVNDADAIVTVEPNAFTVAAGEMVELTVRLRLTTDIAAARWAFGEVRLHPSAAGVPEHHLPIAANLVTAVFPGAKFVYAQRDRDTQIIDGMYSRASDALEVIARGVRATSYTAELLEDETPDAPLDNPDGNTFWRMFTVTDDEDVLFAETRDVGADVDLFIGRDADGNGAPSPSELENDLVCVDGSLSGSELCAAYPLQPGDYWVLVHNFLSEPGATIEQPVYIGFLQGDGSMAVSATGPGSVAHGVPYETRFAWDVPLEHHEFAYALVSVGDNGSRIGNIGNVPVYMERMQNDVRVLASTDKVMVGESVVYTIRVDANIQSGEVRNYVLELELPALLELESVEGEPQRDGGRLTWEVSQEPYGLPTWISFTVRPHRLFPERTLELRVHHQLEGIAGEPEIAVAPKVRILEQGGGNGLVLLAILLLAAGVRRRFMRHVT